MTQMYTRDLCRGRWVQMRSGIWVCECGRQGCEPHRHLTPATISRRQLDPLQRSAVTKKG